MPKSIRSGGQAGNTTKAAHTSTSGELNGMEHSLAYQSKRPYGHPRQYTEEEMKLIRDIHRRNPTLGLTELWNRLIDKLTQKWARAEISRCFPLFLSKDSSTPSARKTSPPHHTGNRRFHVEIYSGGNALPDLHRKRNFFHERCIVGIAGGKP